MTKDRKLLEKVKDIFNGTELNMNNYTEGDVNILNNAMIDAYLLIDSFLATLPEEKEESKWVSVKEKLPKRGTHVLAYKINSIIIVMYYNTDGKFIDRNVDQTNQVTHWMPLPEFNPSNQ